MGNVKIVCKNHPIAVLSGVSGAVMKRAYHILCLCLLLLAAYSGYRAAHNLKHHLVAVSTVCLVLSVLFLLHYFHHFKVSKNERAFRIRTRAWSGSKNRVEISELKPATVAFWSRFDKIIVMPKRAVDLHFSGEIVDLLETINQGFECKTPACASCKVNIKESFSEGLHALEAILQVDMDGSGSYSEKAFGGTWLDFNRSFDDFVEAITQSGIKRVFEEIFLAGTNKISQLSSMVLGEVNKSLSQLCLGLHVSTLTVSIGQPVKTGEHPVTVESTQVH